MANPKNDEVATDWEIAQAMVIDAANEIVRKKEEKQNSYEPWAGIFKPPKT